MPQKEWQETRLFLSQWSMNGSGCSNYYMKDALLAMYIKTSTRIARKLGNKHCILWSAVANVENPFFVKAAIQNVFSNVLNHSPHFEACRIKHRILYYRSLEARQNVFSSSGIYAENCFVMNL